MSNYREVAHSSNSDEWYTPSTVLELARVVLGRIDLDPASNELANRRLVKATNYYDIDDDGLKQPWKARSIWLNPPYSKTSQFVDKLDEEFWNYTNAIVLTKPSVETKWFQKLAGLSNLVWFPDYRIRFLNHKFEEGKSPAHGNALFLITRSDRTEELFKMIMMQGGVVVKPIGGF